MDRHEARDNKVIEELVSSAERGIEVELTRDGRVVARVVPEPAAKAEPEWLTALHALHATLPPNWPRTGWTEAVRAARDED